MKRITLGWWSADLLTGAVNDLHKRYPENEALSTLYRELQSGSDEPIKLSFDDDKEEA